MNVSGYLGLPVWGHKNIDFVDVPTHTDVPLFVDTILMKQSTTSIATSATRRIDGFFATLFQACSIKDWRRVKELLAHTSEPNETHLGLSRGRSQGRGASTDILLPIFKDMLKRGFFEIGAFKEANDLCILTPNFEKDRLSDMLINIIRPELSEFTEMQAIKLGLTSQHAGKYSKECFCPDTGLWQTQELFCLFDNFGKPLLLLPKHWVSKKYTYGTGWFLTHILFPFRQQEHERLGSELCRRNLDSKGRIRLRPPTKKVLRKSEIGGIGGKRYVQNHVERIPVLIETFHREKEWHARKNAIALPNSELDYIVYARNEQKRMHSA